MRFGLLYEHQLPRPWDGDKEHRLFKDALAQVELADRLGIDHIWEVEHHFLEEYAHSSAPEVFLAACALFTIHTPLLLIMIILVVGGFFRSLQFTGVNALAFADVPPFRMSRATTLTSVAQQLSLSIGISIGAVTLGRAMSQARATRAGVERSRAATSSSARRMRQPRSLR